MNEIKNKLKKCQSYFIEKDLMPKLYLKDDNDIEYWIFFYSFVRKLSDKAIGIRLGYYTSQAINKRCTKIINNNKAIITDFLLSQTVSN